LWHVYLVAYLAVMQDVIELEKTVMFVICYTYNIISNIYT